MIHKEFHDGSLILSYQIANFLKPKVFDSRRLRVFFKMTLNSAIKKSSKRRLDRNIFDTNSKRG